MSYIRLNCLRNTRLCLPLHASIQWNKLMVSIEYLQWSLQSRSRGNSKTKIWPPPTSCSLPIVYSLLLEITRSNLLSLISDTFRKPQSPTTPTTLLDWHVHTTKLIFWTFTTNINMTKLILPSSLCCKTFLHLSSAGRYNGHHRFDYRMTRQTSLAVPVLGPDCCALRRASITKLTRHLLQFFLSAALFWWPSITKLT